MINKIKDMFRNKKIVFIIIGVLILVSVFVLVIFKNDNLFIVVDEGIGKIKNEDGVKIKKEFEKLNDVESEEGKVYPEVKLPTNNILEYTNIQNVLDMINNEEDAVIYFGYPSCIYCRSAIEVLCNTAKDTELDVIYYLDIDTKDEKYNELLDTLGDEFIITENDKRELKIPLVIFVVDGKVVSYKDGTVDSHYDSYVELDKYQVEGLSEIYRYGIRDVLRG